MEATTYEKAIRQHRLRVGIPAGKVRVTFRYRNPAKGHEFQKVDDSLDTAWIGLAIESGTYDPERYGDRGISKAVQRAKNAFEVVRVEGPA